MPQTVVRNEATHLYASPPRTHAGRDAVDAILRLHHAEQREIERARASTGLTQNEFDALRYLLQAERDGRQMGPKSLAVMLDVSNASVTKIVDGLVRKGRLRRLPHPTDRRATVLQPAKDAARIVGDAYAGFHTAIVDTIDGMSDADAAALARRLSEIAAALEESAER